MGFITALIVLIVVFLALVKAIVFTETLAEICFVLLAIAVMLSAIFPVKWFNR